MPHHYTCTGTAIELLFSIRNAFDMVSPMRGILAQQKHRLVWFTVGRVRAKIWNEMVFGLSTMDTTFSVWRCETTHQQQFILFLSSPLFFPLLGTVICFFRSILFYREFGLHGIPKSVVDALATSGKYWRSFEVVREWKPIKKDVAKIHLMKLPKPF